ncbi:MAG: hypothetical protein WDZ77_02530 [Candidatus Pacearchaeota archaeon]
MPRPREFGSDEEFLAYCITQSRKINSYFFKGEINYLDELKGDEPRYKGRIMFLDRREISYSYIKMKEEIFKILEREEWKDTAVVENLMKVLEDCENKIPENSQNKKDSKVVQFRG